MNVRSVVNALAITGILTGFYFVSSREQNKERAAIVNENLSLAKENNTLKYQLKGLEKDMLELRKEHVATVFPFQLDTLKNTPIGKRAPEFLERVINNASFLDSLNNSDRNLEKVVKHMSGSEVEEIYLSSKYSSKAAKNLIDFFKFTFKEIKLK